MSSEIGVTPKREKFFLIQNIIIDSWGPIIASDGVAVYCLLARKANSETGIAWMGQGWIADHLGLSVATVGTVLGDLEDLGLITVERQRDPATGRVKRSLYTLVDPVPMPSIKVEDAPRFKRIEQRKSKRASLPTTNSLDKSNLNSLDKTTLNGSVSPQLTVTQYKDSVLLGHEDSVGSRDADASRPPASQPSRNEPSALAKDTPTGSEHVPPRPPTTWDDVQAAPPEARTIAPPRGTTKDAIERALTLVCIPDGDERNVRSQTGQIRAWAKEWRKQQLGTAEDILERFSPGGLYYRSYLAEDADGRPTVPPTPGVVVKWCWNLERMPRRSRKDEPQEVEMESIESYNRRLEEAIARAEAAAKDDPFAAYFGYARPPLKVIGRTA